MAAGNYAHKADVNSKDEIGELATSFNHMSDIIHELIGTLEKRVIEAHAAREQAERSDKVKSAFLASMSHELRTPLNSVINFTKFVARGVMGPVNERQTETLTKVTDSAKHLLNLINDVLDMSKIESGSLTLFVEEEISFNEILKNAASTAEGLLQDKPVELQVEIEENLPTLTADRQRLLQVMLNIISNACKFTETGYIRIRACQDINNQIFVSVQDTGPGIPLEDHAAVFEPFKQTTAGLRQGGGTGLGMPISKSLVEAHGGRMWIESNPGLGSTFCVSLPVHAEILTPTLS
jgi:signal transduction histidine kinase